MANGSALTYYMYDELAEFRFRLAGDLSRDNTIDLDQARQTASSIFGGRRLVVDLTGINNIDAAGRELLSKWHALGAQFVAGAPKAKVQVQSMTSVPITFLGANGGASRWLSARPAIFCLAASLVVVLVVTIIGMNSQIQLLGQP